MRTAVIASKNPVKIRAASSGFKRMFPGETIRWLEIDVPSKVSPQPLSDDETLIGAMTRSFEARRTYPVADFWVGMEAGCGWIGRSLHLFAWVVIVSGDQIGKARTATVPLPTEVVELINQGLELGAATDRVFSRQNSKQGSGAVGILTREVINRESFFEHAAIMALIPFLNADLRFQ
jgi:inosine/xanthosine triphosphatase